MPPTQPHPSQQAATHPPRTQLAVWLASCVAVSLCAYGCAPDVPSGPDTQGKETELAASVEPAGTPALAGTAWQVDDVANRGIPDRAQITIEFDMQGRVAGSAGCNRYSGPYSDSHSSSDPGGDPGGDQATQPQPDQAGTLSIGSLVATRKACVPALMEVEARFLDVLSRSSRYTISEQNVLVITSDDGRSLRATTLTN